MKAKRASSDFRKANADTASFGKKTNTPSEDVGQSDCFTQNHHEVVSIHSD